MFDRIGIRWLLAGGVATGIAGIVVNETLLRNAHEVHYTGSLFMAFCSTKGTPPVCTMTYRFFIGNTGEKTQDRVSIEWLGVPSRTMVATNVSDIIATAHKTVQPVVTYESADNRAVISMSGFAPNTVVDIELHCRICDHADLDAFRSLRPQVEASGKVAHGDPREWTYLRGLMNLLRVIGLFR